MVAAMAAFLLVDICIKLVADEVPIGEILFVVGIGGIIFFGGWLALRGEKFSSREFFSKIIIIRNLGEISGTFGIVTAVVLIPLSNVSAIFQATPLMVTLGAALFLNEHVGWRRWSAILIGFLGVLIIIRPGSEGFQAGSLVALIGVAGQAARDVSTRAAPSTISSIRIGLYGVIALSTLGLLMMIFGPEPVMPTARTLPILLIMMVLGSIGYHALNLAMRAGDVAVIVPFRYVRVLFGVGAGMLFFAERPDIWTYIGAAIIVAAGLYSFMRERKRKAS